jgi:Aldehyde dehydrogenase family
VVIGFLWLMVSESEGKSPALRFSRRRKLWPLMLRIVERCRKRRIRTGQININDAQYNPFAPCGGFKQSGRGREYGKWGLEEFLEVKSMQGG